MNFERYDANQKHYKFQVKNEDETFDETIELQETLVNDFKEVVDFFNEHFDAKYVDSMFNVAIQFALIRFVFLYQAVCLCL